MPTLLETSSATYYEAMLTNTPIVTTDLDFSHDACKDSALYYDPLDAVMAAEKIMTIVRDECIKKELLYNAKTIINQIPTSYEKYNRHLATIKELLY